MRNELTVAARSSGIGEVTCLHSHKWISQCPLKRYHQSLYSILLVYISDPSATVLHLKIW